MRCDTKNETENVIGRILFLGDSITQDGKYISYLNKWIKLSALKEKIELFNCGLSSETVSGLSEPDHPFPRPCLLSRIDQILNEVKPNWVVFCYGMNDAVYYPFSQSRFSAFIQGYKRAILAAREAGARVVLCTPPIFDAESFSAAGGVLLPEGEEKYSYQRAFERYDSVLNLYATCVETDLASLADYVIDIRTPLMDDLLNRRTENRKAVHGDGIHPGARGHRVIARTILKAFWGADAEIAGQIAVQVGE